MNAGPPFAAPVQASWLTNRRAFILAFAITAATFVIDIYTPRGLAISVFPYVLTVALSAGMRARAAPACWFAVCSVLILGGFYLKDAPVSHVTIVNRFTIIALLSVTAVLASLRQRSVLRLQQSHETLEQEVARRTEELRRRNEQLRDSMRELEKAKSSAEASNIAKTRFLAQMSHELRTPLNAIIGFSDLIRLQIHGPVGNPAYLQYSNDIHDSGSNLFQIVESVLAEAQLQQAEYILREEDVDMGSLIGEVVAQEAGNAATRQVHIELRLDPGLPGLHADRSAVRQMLANLLSNAVKFSPDKAAVWVTAEAGAKGFRVEIHDQGQGIAPEDRELVLLPFETGHGADTAGKGGPGLGLSITLGLAKLHNAKLELKSGDPHGTIAILQFPPERTVEAHFTGMRRS